MRCILNATHVTKGRKRIYYLKYYILLKILIFPIYLLFFCTYSYYLKIYRKEIISDDTINNVFLFLII